MGKEIERKFLVKGDAWKALAPGIRYRQGYLNSSFDRTVRVRTIGDQGFITVKGPNNGIARLEFEYVIPADDANEMLTELAEKPLIEKNRYRILRGKHFPDVLSPKNPIAVLRGKHVWEVDEFLGDNAGLVVAEIELGSVDEPFEKPEWIGEEVSGDPRYYNSNLVAHPYSEWK